VNALDYLLKPLDDERVEAALKRARESLAAASGRELGRRLSALLHEVRPEAGGAVPRPDRFVVRSGGRVSFVRVAEIDWVEAQGDDGALHGGGRARLLRETIAAMETKLPPRRFVRIHRSTIVNLDRIAELRPLDNTEYVVILQDGTELKLSRSYRA